MSSLSAPANSSTSPEKIMPGSYAILDAKARQIVGGTVTDASATDPTAAALAQGRIDLAIGYCTSGRLRPQYPGY